MQAAGCSRRPAGTRGPAPCDMPLRRRSPGPWSTGPAAQDVAVGQRGVELDESLAEGPGAIDLPLLHEQMAPEAPGDRVQAVWVDEQRFEGGRSLAQLASHQEPLGHVQAARLQRIDFPVGPVVFHELEDEDPSAVLLMEDQVQVLAGQDGQREADVAPCGLSNRSGTSTARASSGSSRSPRRGSPTAGGAFPPPAWRPSARVARAGS